MSSIDSLGAIALARKNDNSNTSKSKILCKSNNPQAKSLFSMDSLSSRPAEYFQKYIKGPFHKWGLQNVWDYWPPRPCFKQPICAVRPHNEKYLPPLSADLTNACPPPSQGTDGTVRGITYTSGAVWREQRRFTLGALRDLGFGKRSMDIIIQEEAELLIRNLLDESCDGDKTISISGRSLDMAVVNVLWQIVASKRFYHLSFRIDFWFEWWSDCWTNGIEHRSFEQNHWTKNQLNKNLLNKKSIEQVDNWTNIWLIKYPLNKCIWTKLLQQLNKCSIERVVTFLIWLRRVVHRLRLAECVVARQRHEARGFGGLPPF